MTSQIPFLQGPQPVPLLLGIFSLPYFTLAFTVEFCKMGISLSLMSEEKDICSFEEFYSAFLDIFNTFISELPIQYNHIPSKRELEVFFSDWKRAPESQRKELFIGFMKKSISLGKLSDTTLVTGMVTAAIAAKRAGNNVPQLKIINGIPNAIFVLSFTLLSLVSVKLTRNLLSLCHGDAISADIYEEAEEEALSGDQTPNGERKIVEHATTKDRPRQSSSCDSQQAVKDLAQEDQSQKQVGLVFSRQGTLRRPSRKTISRSNTSRSSINLKDKLSSSEQQLAHVDEMLSLFSKFESELTPSLVDIQAALQNVTDALKTGPCILQDPEQVKKLKKALHLISTNGSVDSLSSDKRTLIANLEHEIDKLEAKFRNAEDVVTRALQLQANKEQAEKDFQEAYRLLKEFKAKDDQIKDQIGNLKSELDRTKADQKENLRKINNCFESGKFHKELATKCEMELARLGHARDKAKKDKADIEAAFNSYRQLFT